jgi:hypothetical protein
LKTSCIKITFIAVKQYAMQIDMESMVQTNDQIRLRLLDKCFNLGLPASSRDDISTLKMYLDVDSRLEVDSFNFQIMKEVKKNRNQGIKSLILKMFRI